MSKKFNELGLFDSLSVLQKSTDELTVWSPLTNQLVIVAYPMSRGKRIEPRGFLTWMQPRKLVWRIPLAATSSISITVPDMGLRKRFLDTVSPSQVLPYFKGYFGEHESMYSGLVQSNGGLPAFGAGPTYGKSDLPENHKLELTWIAKARNNASVMHVPRLISDVGICYSPIANTQAPTTTKPSEAGPSRIHEEIRKPAILSTSQYDLLATLGCGDGITAWERSDDLFETCCLVFVMRGKRSSRGDIFEWTTGVQGICKKASYLEFSYHVKSEGY
ncbi:hypothetical protein BDZ97DRAFT_1757636 [Flammula alnicola]|nr:hypothetical protein BDZ97DRAFT_1757636 [Flammula alnicola]